LTLGYGNVQSCQGIMIMLQEEKRKKRKEKGDDLQAKVVHKVMF
jgi:hypothetical protein